ncbi:hypothetical protein AC244_06220 [Ensifer adhaerens]|uniref:Uncharacterized protein n=2 Tax=Ensifer adhaerens TaxID=106592 RepID=A0A0L8C272_ENSAD|nr:hypothetical protein AC244_06220 [Ensifer adhaerens]
MAGDRSDEAAVFGGRDVVPFPMARRLSTIRFCAAELEDLHGDDAVQYWRRECRLLADELLAIGCSEAEMREQVMAFQAEVQAELWQRHQSRLSAGAVSQ